MKPAFRIKRRWARVRFSLEAKLWHEQFLQRMRPMLYVAKGSFDAQALQVIR